jgi:hypothetical protein
VHELRAVVGASYLSSWRSRSTVDSAAATFTRVSDRSATSARASRV